MNKARKLNTLVVMCSVVGFMVDDDVDSWTAGMVEVDEVFTSVWVDCVVGIVIFSAAVEGLNKRV